MSEEPKIEIILPEAIVKLEISTGFYQQMHIMLQDIIEGKTEEEMKDAYAQIEGDDIKEKWITNLKTILIFINDFQKQAKDLGFVKSMTKSEIDEHVENFNKENKEKQD